MSLLRCVSIVGDSNVKRHMSTNNCRDRPLMSGAQVIQCGCASLFTASLKSIRAESNVCVVSCVTNFLTSTTGSSSVTLRVEPVLTDFVAKLTEFACSRPESQFLICPPMYRFAPIWYREGLPEVMQKFSDVLKSCPPNCHLMPSFPTPNFEDDGVHLTAYSGFEFVLHMFDSITSVLSSLELAPEQKSMVVSESSRVLEDRMMVLEQDHRRLNRKFESKTAEDAELSDFQENIRQESFFMIKGLEPREWQDRAKADVQAVLLLLMGREIPVQFVQNSTSRAKDALTQYRVKVATPALSKEIRDTFGAFFLGGKKALPPSLTGISIRNCVTAATLARIAILQLIAKRYLASNPGSKVTVIGYDPRPLLKIFPPASANKGPMTFNFISAISELPTNFTASEKDDLLKRFSPKLHGNLKSVLVVVSDDMLKKKAPTKSSQSAKASAATSGSETSGSPLARSESGKGKGKSQKRGADAPASGSSSSKNTRH